LGNFTIERYCPGMPTVLYEGKTYHTVQIGSQCWLKENLNVGTMIDSLQNPANNGIIEKYCYHNSPANCNTYGGLYAWNEAMQYVTTEGAQGICPPGWHLPTQAEFETLIAAVNNDGNALYGGGTGTNSSGFSALFAGMRHSNGSLRYLAEDAYFYSSSGRWWYGYAYSLFLYKGSSAISFYTNGLEYGFSVRCVKN